MGVMGHIAGWFGCELRRKGEREFPYLTHKKSARIEFDFWIANDQARRWYDVADIEAVPEIAELLKLVRAGDTVLEVGAEHGFFTMAIAAAAGEKGRVVAVEAYPENAMILAAQVAQNRLGSRVTPLFVALSDREGEIWVSDEGKQPSALAQRGSQRVRCVTGDSLAIPGGKADLIKIDVEGFELAVLRGCAKLLAAKPRFEIELHPHLTTDPATHLREVFALIGADGCAGTMIVRTRPDARPEPFDRARVPLDRVTNVFLTPKP